MEINNYLLVEKTEPKKDPVMEFIFESIRLMEENARLTFENIRLKKSLEELKKAI